MLRQQTRHQKTKTKNRQSSIQLANEHQTHQRCKSQTNSRQPTIRNTRRRPEHNQQ